MNSDPAQNGTRQRPDGINPQDWKNRTRISAKLTPVNYSQFVRWCIAKKFNFNSGINHLITTHPDFKKNA